MRRIILYIAGLVGCTSLIAQNPTFYLDQVDVTFSTGTVITAEGDLEIDAGSSITLENSEMRISGDWDNQGTFSPGTGNAGKIYFYGSDTTFITGTFSGSQWLGRVEVDKAYQVPVIYDSPVEIRDSLIFSGGILGTLNNQLVTMTDLEPGKLSGHPLPGSAVDDRYLAGKLTRYVGSSPVTYDLPVGAFPAQGGYQLLRFRPENLGTATLVNAYFFTTGLPSLPSTTECGAYFNCVLGTHGQWGIATNDNAAIFDTWAMPRNFSSGCGAGSYTLYNGNVAHGTSCSGITGTLDPVNGTLVFRDNIGRATGMQVVGAASAFPVEWLAFEAWAEGPQAQLLWITGSETHNDYFVVERSVDGVVFETLGQVQTQGNGTESHEYEFVDPRPQTGANHYRIRQVDLSGEFSFSEVRTVNFEGFQVAIGPSPFSEELTLRYDPAMGTEVQLRVFNALGQLMMPLQSDGSGAETLSVSNWPQGTYLYEISYQGRVLKRGKLLRKH